MVWKSNLEEADQEFIEDFGAKNGGGKEPVPQQSGGVPPVSTYKKAGKKTSGLPRQSAMKSSPSKSQIGGAATNRTM